MYDGYLRAYWVNGHRTARPAAAHHKCISISRSTLCPVRCRAINHPLPDPSGEKNDNLLSSEVRQHRDVRIYSLNSKPNIKREKASKENADDDDILYPSTSTSLTLLHTHTHTNIYINNDMEGLRRRQHATWN